MAEIREQLIQQDHPSRIASMTQAAEQAVDSVSVEIASNMYHKTLTYLPACLAGEDIVNDS